MQENKSTKLNFKEIFDNVIKTIITSGVLWIAINTYQTKMEYVKHTTSSVSKFEKIEADRVADNARHLEAAERLLMLINLNKASINKEHAFAEALSADFIQTKSWLEAILPKHKYIPIDE